MANNTDLEKFGKIYKAEIEYWIKLGLLDKKAYKAAYKLNVIKNDVNPDKFYREAFRAAVMDDFYKFSHSISDVIDRNPRYAEYIKRIDKENVRINRIDREMQLLRKANKPIPRKLVNEQKKLLRIRPDITLVEIPRGLLKSTIFQTHRGAWYYLVGAVMQNQAPVIFVLHEDTNKAEDNLNLIKQILDLDFIKFAFSDVLEKNRDRVSEMSFDVPSDVMRKESHFMAQSIYKDLGGKHGSIFLIDDLELKDNTQTTEQVRKLMDIFLAWTFIDDHLGRTRFEMAGTARREDDVYTYIENELNSVVWREGATTDKDMQPTLFDSEPIYNFPEVYDAANTADYYKKLKRNKGMYYSQIEMIPQPFEDDIDIVSGLNYIYSDDEYSIEYLMKNGCVITSKDPSYSTVNKRKGDGKSRDVTLTGSIMNGILYVFHTEQLLGGDDSTIFRPLLEQVQRFKSDVVVQDCQGTQKNFGIRCNQNLKANGVKHRYSFAFYTKAKQNNSVGKANKASMVLSEYFRMGLIRVNSSLHGLIAELERRTKGFDYLDCLLMIFSLDFNSMEALAESNRHVVKDIVRNNHHEVINKTVGY